MKVLPLAGLLALTLFLPGCIAAGMAVASAGAGVGMGAGVEHTLNGIVYKTFTASANEVRFATLKTLDHMGMPLVEDEATEDGFQMSASAADRMVEIELVRLTPQVTRMRVVANEGHIFFKDAATATEIALQTAQTLEENQAARLDGEPITRKRKAS